MCNTFFFYKVTSVKLLTISIMKCVWNVFHSKEYATYELFLQKQTLSLPGGCLEKFLSDGLCF